MSKIKEYFSAIQSTFSKAERRYKIGVYGNGLVCRTIKGTYADFSWLSVSMGHREYAQYDDPHKYNIKQAEKIVYNSITFDDCIAVGDDYGQW